jgi:hypothetical protein
VLGKIASRQGAVVTDQSLEACISSREDRVNMKVSVPENGRDSLPLSRNS